MREKEQEFAVLGFESGTMTYILDLTWRSPLSLRDGSLLEEEEDWLPSPVQELPNLQMALMRAVCPRLAGGNPDPDGTGTGLLPGLDPPGSSFWGWKPNLSSAYPGRL